MTTPRVVRTREELDAALTEGGAGRRAVVMTMGALHEGHLSLVRTARERADQVVVTVFVNPLQFGPQEDLASYPRDLDRDVALLSGAGADVVFAPDVAEVYPGGEPVVRVVAGRLGDVLEGASRPGHLDGVLTVVLKLMHLVRPDVALFGQKDAQQLAAVRQMVHDLDVPVEVVAVPTVRDADGVALSSRNAYLDPGERTCARALSRALACAQDVARDGASAPSVLAAARAVLDAEPGVALDYLALVDPATVEDVPADHAGPALLAVAARVGATRLIDNVVVDLADGARSPQHEENR
ncbi:pantoate--beta-alanine ligase [Actinotalea subterranea]|uniref:pantoate--beta-alanine ligase n=1 Tax=Actinotalea subterranea TaxID=2607497 RepID=UPI0011EBDAC0|nr:pantoate--beta-alanine ligase [Actinotalea subterranea]